MIIFLGFLVSPNTTQGQCTLNPVLAVTSIKQPTYLKQPHKMFPNVYSYSPMFKQPPALSSLFLCFPCVAA